MANPISRRKFFQILAAINVAVTIHFLFPKTVEVAAQDNPWTEESLSEDLPESMVPQQKYAAAGSVISVHYRPSVIYIKG